MFTLSNAPDWRSGLIVWLFRAGLNTTSELEQLVHKDMEFVAKRESSIWNTYTMFSFNTKRLISYAKILKYKIGARK